jgi:sialic acid synthase SpsE
MPEKITLVAEAGINHAGDMGTAMKMVAAAKRAGADFVKFQSYQTDALVSRTLSPDAHATLKAAELSFDDQRALFAECGRVGVAFLSTPFDDDSAGFLNDLGVTAFKIASGDLTHVPLLKTVAGFKKPVFLSTGMGSLDEVERALAALKDGGCPAVTVLQCTTAYPAPYADANLRAIPLLKRRLKVPVGYSDHTQGVACAVAAVALGATIIEKHFALDLTQTGPDIACSVDEAGLKLLRKSIDAVSEALGEEAKHVANAEEKAKVEARRSIFAARHLPKGTVLTESCFAYLRPGYGIGPSEAPNLVGKTLKVDLQPGEMITWESV